MVFTAVKDDSGHYHLNGHLVIENGRSEIVRIMAGSKFKYKMLDDSRDYLYSLGPIQDSLIIQVCLSVCPQHNSQTNDPQSHVLNLV